VKFFIVLVTLVLILFIPPQALGHVPVHRWKQQEPVLGHLHPGHNQVLGHIRPPPGQAPVHQLRRKERPDHLCSSSDTHGPSAGGFKPEMALIFPGGPASTKGSPRPDLQAQVAQNYSILLIPSSRPMNATYEAFGPNSFYRGSRKSTSLPRSQVGITWRSLVMAAEVTA
jgi:hypothetical protein